MKNFKIPKAKLKREINIRVFEEFIKDNLKYFKKHTLVEEKYFNSYYKYVSKGGSIELRYYSKRTDKIPNYLLTICINKIKKIKKTKFFFTTTTDELSLEFYYKNTTIQGNHKIDPSDEKLFEEVKKIKSIYSKLKKTVEKELINDLILKDKDEKQKLKDEKQKLKNSVSDVLKELDKDNNGVIDIIEDDPFKNLLQKHQKLIITIDKSYIQHFVKISSFLNDKKTNIQTTFKSLKKVSNLKELKTFIKILKNQKHTYNLLLFHSISMITSLTKKEQDLITFYEIYEHFDRLKIFQSDHEKDVSNELKQLNFKTSQVVNSLGDLMYRINSFENSMIDSLNELSYTTQNGFDNLRGSITSELKSINSSIGLNNLLTGIQTYQVYKINKNIKSLN